jgi:hypothetical protein
MVMYTIIERLENGIYPPFPDQLLWEEVMYRGNPSDTGLPRSVKWNE